MKTRTTALALTLVLILAMASSAFALPDNYKHHCPEIFADSEGYYHLLSKNENPLANNGNAYVFAKFVPETCSIWVYAKYQVTKVDTSGELIVDEDDNPILFGGLKHLCVFKYTEDKRVIDMVAFENAFKCHQKGAELPITEAGRYFAAVCDIHGFYTLWPGADFVITEDMLLVVEETIEDETEVVE